jgi:DNA transposition AAA+ family ATPase
MNLIPGKTEFTEAEHADLITRVKRVRASGGLSQADIGRQAEVPSSSLSQYLNGAYPNEAGRAEIAAKLTRWLKALDAEQSLRRQLPVAPTYVALKGSKKISTLLAYARQTGRMVLVTGVPGVSKTASARQFREDNPRTWYTAMDPSTRGVPTMLLEILAAMGVSDAKGTPQALMRMIHQHAVEAKGLIIIDEAQHLSEQAIEALRAINDRSRATGSPVGIAMLGNEMAYNRVGTTGTQSAFAQVSSRFAQRRWIVAPDAEDAAALARAWAETNGEEITSAELSFCQLIATKPGGLRNIEMTMESALLAARGGQEPLTIDHLRAAFEQLSGVTHGL